MNYVKCRECGEELHRREYRKRGGGFYTTCKTCRAKLKAAQNYKRSQITKIRKLNDYSQAFAYKVLKVKQLTSEYKSATRLNRNRIKALEKNKNPTRATIMWLNKRRAIQQVWTDALNTLITHVHQDRKVTTLREYMERVDQHANHNTGL